MSVQWQSRVSVPVLEFRQVSETLKLLFQIFTPHPVHEPETASEIDWEDGEPHRERDAEIAAH
jgi:hypothetical protein